MDAMLGQFAEQAPVAVMARLGMPRAIEAEWVDQIFEQHRTVQYTRELLFSTVVDLMSLVGRRASRGARSGSKGNGPTWSFVCRCLGEDRPRIKRILVRSPWAAPHGRAGRL